MIDTLHHMLIHSLVHVKNLIASLHEIVNERRRRARGDGLSRDKVNVLLLGSHALDILFEIAVEDAIRAASTTGKN